MKSYIQINVELALVWCEFEKISFSVYPKTRIIKLGDMEVSAVASAQSTRAAQTSDERCQLKKVGIIEMVNLSTLLDGLETGLTRVSLKKRGTKAKLSIAFQKNSSWETVLSIRTENHIIGQSIDQFISFVEENFKLSA